MSTTLTYHGFFVNVAKYSPSGYSLILDISQENAVPNREVDLENKDICLSCTKAQELQSFFSLQGLILATFGTVPWSRIHACPSSNCLYLSRNRSLGCI